MDEALGIAAILTDEEATVGEIGIGQRKGGHQGLRVNRIVVVGDFHRLRVVRLGQPS